MTNDSTDKLGPSRWPWALGIVVTGMLGLGIGAAATTGASTPAEREPEPAVTVTTEPEVVVETKDVIPLVCTEALQDGVDAIQAKEDLVNVKIDMLGLVLDGQIDATDSERISTLGDEQEKVIARVNETSASFILSARECDPGFDGQ